MSTPNSSATPYCTAAAFLERVDWRSIGQLITDGGTVPASSAAVQTVPLLNDILMEASGMVESACTLSNRYAIADLAALTGNSAQMLAGMVAGLALWLIWERRPNDKPLPSRAQASLDMLEKLADGAAILGILETAQAGVIDHSVMKDSDWESIALLPKAARRYFGTRSDSLNG